VFTASLIDFLGAAMPAARADAAVSTQTPKENAA
jgi:hypothetical protein